MASRGLRPLIPAALTLAALLAFTGCADRTGPSSTGTSRNPDARFVMEPPIDASPDAQGLSGRTRTSLPNGPLTVYQIIDGSVGGQVKTGRFTLTVPPGAFSGTRQFTLEDANNGYLECHLYPEGMVFDVPVTLSIDLSSSAIDGPDATIYWLDPQAGEWIDLGGAYFGTEHKVSAQLRHFCAFRGGRAGW